MDDDQLKAMENSESNKRFFSVVNVAMLLILAFIVWNISVKVSLFIFLCAAGMGFYLWRNVVAYRRRNAISTSTISTTQTREEEDHALSKTLPKFKASSTYTVTTPLLDKVNGHTIYPHIHAAVTATGRTLDTSLPIPTDLGLLAYREDAKPMLYRAIDIPKDTQYIQPYLQLHTALPLLKSAVGEVRFEIRSSDHQLLFSHQQDYTLNDGLNLITPPTRLRIDDTLDLNDQWILRITLGNRWIAEHTFGWSGTLNGFFNAVGADGEISEALRALIEQQIEQPLSVDDLLANQASEGKQDSIP